MTVFRVALMSSVLMACSCGFLPEMERVPSSSELLQYKFLQPFNISPEEVTGAYQNRDIDSLVYFYSTKITDENVFWKIVVSGSKESGWSQLPTQNQTKRFQRFYGPRGPFRSSGSEEIRIWFNSKKRMVAVAWVQADMTGKPLPVSETQPEAQFADQEIWPRLNRIIKDSGG